MKKTLLLFSLLIGIVITAAAQTTPTLIELTEEGTDTIPRPRSVVAEPVAYMTDQCIIINYPLSSTSKVIICDAGTGVAVFSNSYDATRQVIVDLSTLPAGTYELCLYACGKWWWGEFELEK